MDNSLVERTDISWYYKTQIMKKIIIYISAFAMIAVLASGCAKKPSSDTIVLAKISNSTITLGEFNAKIAKLPSYYQRVIVQNKMRYLEEMIAEKLFYEDAVRKGLNNDKEVAEIVKDAKKRFVIAKLIKNEIDDKTTVSEDEIKAFYEANKDTMKTPEMWRASHILVPTEEEAKDIQQQLASGAKFEDLAKARSKDATASRGGDVGYFRTGQLVPDFENVAIKLNVGQTSDIVHTKFGYHIIRLTDKKEPGIQSYEKAKPVIENELKKKKKVQMFERFILELKKKYGVVVNDSAINAIAAPKEPDAAGAGK